MCDVREASRQQHHNNKNFGFWLLAKKEQALSANKEATKEQRHRIQLKSEKQNREKFKKRSEQKQANLC